MKKLIKLSSLFLLATTLIFTACKDDKDDTSPGSGNGTPQEETIFGTWEVAGSNLPNQQAVDRFDKWELQINEDRTYSWKYFAKDGNVSDFTGTVSIIESENTHTSGSLIHSINVDVTHINGNPAPGGWAGIYTFEGAGTLVFNVEPNVNGWPKFPTTANGVGSGNSGAESVYRFQKK